MGLKRNLQLRIFAAICVLAHGFCPRPRKPMPMRQCGRNEKRLNQRIALMEYS